MSAPATFDAKAWGSSSATAPLEFFKIQRRVPNETDVKINIEYCGICHSDYHTIKGDWGPTPYTCVPGHEIVGTVTEVGSAVTKFKVGDFVGVGCFVDSCRTCACCKDGFQQHCDLGMVGTYGAPDKHIPGAHTLGGYSSDIVVTEDYVLRIPTSLDRKAVAPLLCAGITTYSPLRQAGVTTGSKVGVVGLGGLGHMAIKLAKAMGAEVTMITTTPSKAADAERLGASHVILSKEPEQLKAAAGTLDFIIDTVSAQHDVNVLIGLLKTRGKLCFVGAPPTPHAIGAFPLIMGNKTIFGSLIGGLPETQEMLDFCGKHNIVSDAEIISVDDINEAYERMLKSDVKYRFVIDMESIKKYE
jgi:uncharacterized zinc-type alcohol dehydrogenase-like protein